MNVRNLVKAACLLGVHLMVGTPLLAQLPAGFVTLSGDVTGTRTLSADSVYFVQGVYRILSGGTLNIPAGTLIMGNGSPTDSTQRCAIQVHQGATLNATGTQKRPIILTSSSNQGSRAAGQGPGIIWLGNALLNTPSGTGTIEGGTGATYGGGGSPNNTQNSGTLRYARIEYAGAIFSTNNEINSLTMGALGSGTTVDYVQTSYGLDDGFEWFGGTVNANHLISFGNKDDDFDTDFGYTGIVQWAFALRDNTQNDVSGSNGLEADTDGSSGASTPKSQPKFANLTLVGPQYDGVTTAAANFTRGAHWRRQTGYNLYNSVVTGWPTGMRLEDNTATCADGGWDDVLAIACVGTYPATQPATLETVGVIVTGGTTSVQGKTRITTADATDWFDNGAGTSRAVGHAANVGLRDVDQADLNNPDPRPNVGAAAATGGQTLPGIFGGRTSTGYRGAFDPSTTRQQQWDNIWAQYNPQGTSYIKHKRGWAMVALANTPTGDGDPAQKDSIYRFANGNAFRFNPATGYTSDNSLDSKVGYFLLLDSTSTVEQTGSTVSLPTTTSSLTAGWQLVATGASAKATAANTQFNGGSTSLTFFGFDPAAGYTVATQLEPGKAYWVLIPSGGGTLTFNP